MVTPHDRGRRLRAFTGRLPDAPQFVATGENILMGHRGAQDAHLGWMRSDGHRENILEVGYDAVGIGVVCRNDGSMWATQIFVVARSRVGGRWPVDTAPDPIVADQRGPSCPVVYHGPFR